MRKLLLAGLLLLISACDSNPIVAPARAAILPGQAIQLTVAGQVAGTVSWRVVEPNGGTITGAGPTVTYTAPPCGPAIPGVYHIEATADGVSSTAEIAVTDSVKSVAVSPPTARLVPGATQQFTATVTTYCGVVSSSTLKVVAPLKK